MDSVQMVLGGSESEDPGMYVGVGYQNKVVVESMNRGCRAVILKPFTLHLTTLGHE
jgi:hypothetical protein